jgi:hypothetical protein
MSNESQAKAGEFLPAMVDPRVEEARAAVRALLAPTGKDLETLLINLHRESAQSQRKARKSQQKLRDELYKRLEEGQTLVIHGNEVVVSVVTNRELIGMMEAESNLVKVEAMAQRSYTVHRVVARAASPQGGSIEEFIDRLEAEEQTEAPDQDVAPDW